MTWRVEVSNEAQQHLAGIPRNIRVRLRRAIEEFEAKDESQWSNIKALQGPEWKGRFRKKVGPYRIIFRKVAAPPRPNATQSPGAKKPPAPAAEAPHGVVEISAVLIRSKKTYR